MNNYTLKLLEDKEKGYPERKVILKLDPNNKLINILIDEFVEVEPYSLLLVLKHRKTETPLPKYIIDALKSSAIAELV